MFQKFLDSQVLQQLMLKLCFLKHKDNMNAKELESNHDPPLQAGLAV